MTANIHRPRSIDSVPPTSAWQRERMRGPVLPMTRPSLWRRIWGRG